MKKLLILFSIILALLLSACGKEEVPSNTSTAIPENNISATPAPTQPPATPTPVPTQTPTEPIREFVLTEDGQLEFADKMLTGLTAAELYVKQLDQSFIITESERLRELEAALSLQLGYPFYLSGEYNVVDDIESANPLYLYFEDGSSRLIHTMADGSCGTTIWDRFGFNSNKSIFDMFGVPLEAAGYTYNADGTTTVTTYTTLNAPGPEAKEVQEERHTVYAPDGKVLSKSSPYAFYYGGAFLHEYKYDEYNKLLSITVSSEGVILETQVYEYNEFDKISKHTSYDTDGNWTVRYEYSYDEQGRIVAEMDYYAIGTQGVGTFFWYDENGEQHSYTYEHDGSIYGEAPPDGPIRK